MTQRKRFDRFAGDKHRIIPLAIPDAVVRQIAVSIRLQDPGRIACLRQHLAGIGGRYQRWRRQEAGTPCRREQLELLRRVQSSASKLVVELEALGEDSRFRIGLCHPPKDDDGTVAQFWRSQVVERLTADLRQFETATKRAIAGTARPGPRTDASSYFLVQLLSELYTELTGEPASHNPYDKTEYKGTPQSIAGRFILAAFKAIDSTIRPTAVNTAIGALVKQGARAAPSIK
jgi:hypothetical protein